MLAPLRLRLDSWRLIAVFGVIYFASQLALAVIVHPLGPDMLVVQTTLSADHVRQIFARWDAAGLLGTYARHYRLDMIHPLWYAMFLAAALAKGFNANRVPARWNAVLLLPFVAGACDVLENVIHLTFLADRANITDARVLLANGAARLKWFLAFGCVIGFVALGLRSRFKRRAST